MATSLDTAGRPHGGDHGPGAGESAAERGAGAPVTPRPVRVTIAYCAECGYEPQTLALAGTLMTTFGHALSSIELIPWYDGSFEVSVGGQLVHSMLREGGFPEHATVVQAVRQHLGAQSGETAEGRA